MNAGSTKGDRYNKALLESVLNSSHTGIMVFEAIRNKQNRIEDFGLLLVNAQAKDHWQERRRNDQHKASRSISR